MASPVLKDYCNRNGMTASRPSSTNHGLESPRGPRMKRRTSGPMIPGSSLIRTSVVSVSRLLFWSLGKRVSRGLPSLSWLQSHRTNRQTEAWRVWNHWNHAQSLNPNGSPVAFAERWGLNCQSSTDCFPLSTPVSQRTLNPTSVWTQFTALGSHSYSLGNLKLCLANKGKGNKCLVVLWV